MVAEGQGKRQLRGRKTLAEGSRDAAQMMRLVKLMCLRACGWKPRDVEGLRERSFFEVRGRKVTKELEKSCRLLEIHVLELVGVWLTRYRSGGEAGGCKGTRGD